MIHSLSSGIPVNPGDILLAFNITCVCRGHALQIYVGLVTPILETFRYNCIVEEKLDKKSGNTVEPVNWTTVGTEGSGPIRGVVLLKGWSKMAPRTMWDNKKYRGNLYILILVLLIRL